ncbi:MAG: tRNA (adenosine(37)-N6)-threonylcarbamoyltransferase complex transferase subunit TsaD [Candidatus Shikimatogenerans bostrichidophilus]|nr:MAG: tRNA (adenosine(37)-N6)-threonylcarbamoyltransferase complex transferase subunit TsaD [Candidatus Shikimatogenerans bostrichidophilus]
MIKKIFNNKKIILGIETSFDDTSASILKGNKILSNIIYSQKIHTKYNGVVPNIASNIHLKNIYNVVKKCIFKANIDLNNINCIAFTKGPGLINSLFIGENFAKSLSLSLNKPLIGINHIHGHIFSHFLYKKNNKYPNFPFICLSMSGGHTKIIIVYNFLKFKTIGDTLDDTLGNLFDKFSNYLGLKYPNGPSIMEKYIKNGNNIFKFPIPNVKNLNFSFSGLKTYLKNFINKNINLDKNFIKKNINNLCKSFHITIYKILLYKINKVIKLTKIKNIVFSGGVANNLFLKKKFINNFKKKKYKLYIINNKKLNKDNAAIIGLMGQIKYYYKLYDNFKIKSKSNISLNEL